MVWNRLGISKCGSMDDFGMDPALACSHDFKGVRRTIDGDPQGFYFCDWSYIPAGVGLCRPPGSNVRSRAEQLAWLPAPSPGRKLLRHELDRPELTRSPSFARASESKPFVGKISAPRLRGGRLFAAMTTNRSDESSSATGFGCKALRIPFPRF